MAITISDKVGQKPPCINLPEDVVKIKNALNRISTVDGGFKESPPNQKMDETSSLMDERTLEAIQKFQLKQFGWSGADRRIFPNGQTITRINELLPEEQIIPTETNGKANIFFFQISPAERIFANDIIYLIFDDIQNRQRAKYKVVRKNMPEFDTQAQVFSNQQRMLWQGLPISVRDFNNADFQYATAARNDFQPNSQLTIIKENIMGIKTVSEPNWKLFNTGEKPYLVEIATKPLDTAWKENPEEWFRGKIVGKLSLVEFETW